MSIDSAREKIMHLMQKSKLKAGQTIILSFLIVIFIGTILLALPISSVKDGSVGVLTALFTSTSAVCVTGLVVVNTAETWTTFGKIVILMLIQIGGLGFMAMLMTFFLGLRKKITLKDRVIIQQSFNQQSIEGMVKLVKLAVKGTLVVETIGAIILTIAFLQSDVMSIGIGKSLWYGVFHSISAFCNAGFDIIGTNSFMGFYGNVIVNFTIMILIISGGLGFAVWADLIKVSKLKYAESEKKMSTKEKLRRLTLHSKIAITTSAILIVAGAVLIFLIEFSNPNSIGGLSLPNKIMASIFHSVSLRTAGFNTIDIMGLTDASKFISITLMIIGGSPGGTAGGMKTVTTAVVILGVVSVVKGKSKTEAFHRTIPDPVFKKVLSIVMIYLMIFIVATLMLLISQDQITSYSFIDVAFEVASAVGTVGLTTGLTPQLGAFGRIIIIVCMFIGRVGPISVAIALTSAQDNSSNLISYPEENILVG